MVLETLAIGYYKSTMCVGPKHWFSLKYPYVAIAMVLCAVSHAKALCYWTKFVYQLERAFDSYRETGIFNERTNNRGQDAFSEANWGVAAAGHIAALRSLRDSKVQVIVSDAQAVLLARRGKRAAGTEGGPTSGLIDNEFNSRANVEESDIEEASSNLLTPCHSAHICAL